MKSAKSVCILLLALVSAAAAVPASAMELELGCRYSLNGGESALSYETFRLDSRGVSSKSFMPFIGLDRFGRILVSLHETGRVCEASGCDQTTATIHSLTLMRFEDSTAKQEDLQSGYSVEVRGTTNRSIRYELPDDGSPVLASFERADGKMEWRSATLPNSIAIQFRVKKGRFAPAQRVDVECSILSPQAD